MNNTTIGENAGKVWHIINEKGDLTYFELLEYTEISEQELLMAIGWLSREGKIYQLNMFTKNWIVSLTYNDFSYGF